MITLESVSKTYFSPNNLPHHALSDINLSIKPQEIFAILGKSGAGKSTLLRSINLLEQPTAGKIFVNQKEITGLDKRALREERKKISMIFQHFNLLRSRDVFSNIALPLELIHVNKHEITSKVNELLDLVDLVDRKHFYPDQLSGGQKQRVAIARALATNPNILLCDEATSALDVNSTQAILNLLKTIREKLQVTIVLITHELNVAKQIADSVAIIEQGKIVELGSVTDIFTKPQSQIGKQLVNVENHLVLAPSFKEALKARNGIIVRLTFSDSTCRQAIIAHLIKHYEVTINILLANIELVQETPIGFAVCQIEGDKENVKQALNYLNDLDIQLEVINHD